MLVSARSRLYLVRKAAVGAIACLLAGVHVVPASADGPQQRAGTLYDYLVMNVCVDANDRLTNENPLQCSRQRDIRPGERLPYYHANYAPEGLAAKYPCYQPGTSRRYAFPLGLSGTDSKGKPHPLIVAWTDFTPVATECTWSHFDKRDSATVLAIADGYASIMGSVSRGKVFACLGEGATDTSSQGVEKYAKCWPFPEAIPATNTVGYGVFMKKTQHLGPQAELTSAAGSEPAGKLARTAAWWTHMPMVYGPLDRPTKALDSLIQFGFAQTNSLGDAPGGSTGSERLYLTKELGYVTRWESWQMERSEGKDVRALARKAYENNNCGTPANVHGVMSPHFEIAPVVTDPGGGGYSQEYTITDAKGHRTKNTWYMVGCHDYTNVGAQPPLAPNEVVTSQMLGREFLRLFGVRSEELPK